jgi:hypothetical protein
MHDGLVRILLYKIKCWVLGVNGILAHREASIFDATPSRATFHMVTSQVSDRLPVVVRSGNKFCREAVIAIR